MTAPLTSARPASTSRIGVGTAWPAAAQARTAAAATHASEVRCQAQRRSGAANPRGRPISHDARRSGRTTSRSPSHECARARITYIAVATVNQSVIVASSAIRHRMDVRP